MEAREKFDRIEMRVYGFMAHFGMYLLRFGLAVVFIWFGILKPFDASPARQLVLDSTAWIPIPHFLYVLGVWEVVIGICFLYRPLLRIGVVLLLLHMPGTALPFFLCPEACWISPPFCLSLEGQYIVKNLVLVGAALVIAGTIRHRSGGFARFTPAELVELLDQGQWLSAPAGATLVAEGERPKGIYYIKEGKADVYINNKWVANLRENQFVGEISFLTGEDASATVRAKTPLRYLHWKTAELKHLIRERPNLAEALYASFSIDLICKLRDRH